jgi:dTMP kinase
MESATTPKPHPARFVTFEGGEGVGKSTQVKRLVDRLAAMSVAALRTREPGGTPKAEAVRSFLLQGRSETWGPDGEAILFAAARLDHVNQLIAPALDAGKWVVSDRFCDSTRVYQGLNGGVDETLIGALEVLALNGHNPDLTLMLDMDSDKAFERVMKRAVEGGMPPDRFEKEGRDWHRRLREGFLRIAADNAGRCVVVDADRSPEELEAAIWDIVSARFAELRPATNS